VRIIAHLSDLHFGAVDVTLVTPLLDALGGIVPDLVAISGDFTQRARRRQFAEARAFLDRLRWPVLAVPGNHDIPLFDLARRFLDPLGRYRTFISADLAPVFADDEIVVVGLNSARGAAFRHGEGRLNEPQVIRAAARLDLAPPSAVKIVVTHHPFDLPAGHQPHHLIGRANMAMGWLAAAGADLLLAGHLHVSHIGKTAERYQIAGHSALVVQAGTISRRERGELNSFNVLRVSAERVEVERHTWDPTQARFTKFWAGAFERAADGWTENNPN
jgi:3',5'-cyclic AMP phosphodiesterase CpdA